MVPAVQFNGMLCFETHPEVRPAHGEVEAKLAPAKIQPVALPLRDILYARHDRAVACRWINPGRKAEGIEIIEICNFPGIYKTPAVKAGGLARLARHKAERDSSSRRISL